ncbi:MAG: sugar transferase [Bacteroidia bacterium]|jgi:lipopolysaccharide/colanic/teichoic acid biosynthesis glycosyltransferase
MLKRAFDLLLSAFGLLLISPLLLVCGAWVLLDSRGPVFYSQDRVGRKGAIFKLIKFRSMKSGSDRSGLLTVGGRDARITRSGYYLRKYKLDELPQLFNVLMGDMSLVGPRPEVPKYVALYTPQQLEVLSLKPGITDWASLKYFDENELLGNAENPEQVYIEEIMPAKLSINLEYVKNRSLLGDCEIILLTLLRIVKR